MFSRWLRTYCYQGCTWILVAICLWSIGGRSHLVEAAVAPTEQFDRCGPYYIWYQTGPESYTQPTDYIDLYGITFDISDVVDDFDFVYFTDKEALQRVRLDKDQDGISDRYFYRIHGNQLEWKPKNGPVRITQRGCWGSRFNDNCGYAMISIQPKPWFQNGVARIPIHVTKKCSPTGVDCSERLLVYHEYSDCSVSSLPDFTIEKQFDKERSTVRTRRYTIYYHIIIQNVTNVPGETTLTDTVTSGTEGGRLELNYFNIDCPDRAACTILRVSNDLIKVSLTDVPAHEEVTISYSMEIDKDTIPRGEISYFTNTATLSTGGSAKVTQGVWGTGPGIDGEPERRSERPRD